MNLNLFPYAACLACASVTLFAASAHGEDEPQVIELGGLRQATAVVVSDDTEHTVAVQMIPVKAFDASLNAAISRRLLIEAALRGLAKAISKEPITLTVGGLTAGELSIEKDACRLTVQIPVAGLEVQSAPAPGEPKSGHPGGPTTDLADDSSHDPTLLQVNACAGLLSRKHEYAELIDTLASTLIAEVGSLPITSVDEPDADDDSAAVKLAASVTGHFDALSLAIQDDLMLLSIEKQDLLQDIRSQQQKLLNAIRRAAVPSTMSRPRGNSK